MSDIALATSFAQQLDSLIRYIREGWAWPSPSLGFGLHLFKSVQERFPVDVGSLTLAEEDYLRMDQAPVLATVGYMLALRSLDARPNMLTLWAEGFERLSLRSAFPPDRQSFVYRPYDLYGLALGVLHYPALDTSMRSWFLDVLNRGEDKVGRGSFRQRMLHSCSASIHGLPSSAPPLPPFEDFDPLDLALAYWLGTAYPNLFAECRQRLVALGEEIRKRCAVHLVEASDLAEASALYFSLHRAVQGLLGGGAMDTQDGRRNVRAFISYSHDRDYWEGLGKDPDTQRKRVLELAQRLRSEGIDCTIDQLIANPLEGWPRWMLDRIEEADFVLVVATETYNRRFRGHEERTRGHGSQWEGAIITQELYDLNGRNGKFLPIVFTNADAEHRPLPLRSATYYNVGEEAGYDDLYFYLTGQPAHVPRPLGPIRPRT